MTTPEEFLREENTRLKKEIENLRWATSRTGEGVKSLYKELEVKNSALRKLDDLKSDFVSTVSHELRTPLTIIREGASLIRDRVLGEINPGQEDMLGDVLRNIDRLTRIINDLLDMSKLELGKTVIVRAEVRPEELLSEAVKEFKVRADAKQITLSVQSAAELPSLHGDRERLL